MDKELSIQKIFKPYIAKRKNGQCQVLIPLVELDEVCDAITKLFNEEMLRLIGDNEKRWWIGIGSTSTWGSSPKSKDWINGRNTLRAELRKKVGE
jgi:hypothetical protein